MPPPHPDTHTTSLIDLVYSCASRLLPDSHGYLSQRHHCLAPLGGGAAGGAWGRGPQCLRGPMGVYNPSPGDACGVGGLAQGSVPRAARAVAGVVTLGGVVCVVACVSVCVHGQATATLTPPLHAHIPPGGVAGEVACPGRQGPEGRREHGHGG
ncbi:hypothetical protein GWK47_004629 [Chionoecetes opilio]|uniref:Uncharacterized protein n=1 Tax=Chionoecetes opilio TaxID=41210 RepID=A0A8J4YM47_CHIOP|nr:hypothetical protein GWK47_004629 [Chionoecetes opilio]